jgi:hypothetical protein
MILYCWMTVILVHFCKSQQKQIILELTDRWGKIKGWVYCPLLQLNNSIICYLPKQTSFHCLKIDLYIYVSIKKPEGFLYYFFFIFIKSNITALQYFYFRKKKLWKQNFYRNLVTLQSSDKYLAKSKTMEAIKN